MGNLNENNAKGCLLLFEVVLSNKSQFTDIPSNFILATWKVFNELQYCEEYNDNFHKALSLVCEHISVELFPTLLKDLLNSAVSLLIIFYIGVLGGL